MVVVGAVGEFQCEVLILLRDIRALSVEPFVVSIKKKNLPVPAPTPTPPPPLTAVSELANNSPKRNLNTMNLGD